MNYFKRLVNYMRGARVAADQPTPKAPAFTAQTTDEWLATPGRRVRTIYFVSELLVLMHNNRSLNRDGTFCRDPVVGHELVTLLNDHLSDGTLGAITFEKLYAWVQAQDWTTYYEEMADIDDWGRSDVIYRTGSRMIQSLRAYGADPITQPTCTQ